MKICAVPVHGFSAPKLNWRLPNLGRMCCIPEKPPKRIDVVSDITFAGSDIIRPDLGTALIENYVDANIYVLVAFQEIQ